MNSLVSKMRGNKKGFTLVELIIVIVILAILAAIAVPAMVAYIQDANDAQMKSNCRTVVSAVAAAFADTKANKKDKTGFQKAVNKLLTGAVDTASTSFAGGTWKTVPTDLDKDSGPITKIGWTDGTDIAVWDATTNKITIKAGQDF